MTGEIVEFIFDEDVLGSKIFLDVDFTRVGGELYVPELENV